MIKNLDKKIRAYALKNAVEHEGKAVMGSVISGLFAEGLKRENAREASIRVSQILNEVNRKSRIHNIFDDNYIPSLDLTVQFLQHSDITGTNLGISVA